MIFIHKLVVMHFLITINLVNSVGSTTAGGISVNQVRNRQVTPDGFYIIDRLPPKQPLKNTGDHVNHHHTALVPQHGGQLTEDFHGLCVNDKWRSLGDRSTLVLHVQTKISSQLEDGVRGDVIWYIFMAFSLVSNVDEPVVHTHLHLCWRFISTSFGVIKLFETLQCVH